MQHNNSGNLEQPEEKTSASLDLHEEIALIRESLNQTRTEMSLYRRRIEKRQIEVDAHIRRTNGLWIGLFVFIGGLGTAVAYGFHSGTLAVRLPVTLSISSGTQAHLSSPEEKTSTPNPAAEVPQNPNAVQATSADSERAQVANAKENLAGVPPQNESTDTVNSTPNSERAGNPGKSDARLLADAVNRNRIDFEVSPNKTKEVAPGIFLTVRDTDVERQQINGWLQISAEGRTVWLHDQGAQKAMIFTTKRDERRHELIFTRVGKRAVSGYLLIPTITG